MVQLKKKSEGVFLYDSSEPFFLNKSYINYLIKNAGETRLKRSRLCLHASDGAICHEMIIAVLEDSYVEPHSHNKRETLSVIEGICDVIIFDNDGTILSTNQLISGSLVSLKPGTIHAVLVRSDFIILHETTEGPFNPLSTQKPSWSPKTLEFFKQLLKI